MKARHISVNPRIVGKTDRHAYGNGSHCTIDGLRIVHRQDVENFKIERVKPTTSIADGQYTRLTAIASHHGLFIDRDDRSVVYRYDPRGMNAPTPILKCEGSEWYPLTLLEGSEREALAAFNGAAGMDVDQAIAKQTAIKRKGSSPSLMGHERQRLDKYSDRSSSLKRLAPIKGVQIR
jgi:hypothetical protein